MARTSPLIQPTHRPYPRGYQPLPPQKPVNAHPSNAIYATGTGAGTGTAAKKIGYQNRDGTRSPVSSLGGPTGPLSQPMPRMTTSATGQRQKNIAQAKADGTFGQKQLAYNQANPGLHMDAGGNIYEHPEAEKRLAASKNNGNDIPLDGKGGYAKSESPLTTPSSTAGQAQSMRESMAPNAGEDRYGRTSASPSAGGKPVAPASPLLSSSAKGDWQQGDPNTRFKSDKYGAGSSKITTPADRASNVANAVNSTGGTFQKLAAGVSAATTRPSAPILPGGVGAASTRSPTTPTSPQIVDKQTTPAYTPKPSAVPAEDLKRYADAYEKVKAQDAAKAAADAGKTTASSPITTPSAPPQAQAQPPAIADTASPSTPSPLMPGAGFTGPSGEAAARMAKQNDAAEAAAAKAKADAAMQSLDKYSSSGFKPSPMTPPVNPSAALVGADTAAKNAARGVNDAADLARYKAEDAASGTSPLLQSSSPPQGGSQMADAAAAEEEARRLKEEQDAQNAG